MKIDEAQLAGKRIAIVGAGAVGSYYGGMLAHGGHDVHFLLRSDLAAVKERGMWIHTKGEKIHLQPVQCAGRPEEIGPVDLVIIALKATANGAMRELLPPLIGPDTALLTLQNGLGNEEFLAEHWGAARVLGALCFVCINRMGPGDIHHLDHGSISIGEFGRPVSPRVKAIAEAFRAVSVEANPVENLAAEHWRKLVWNIPFNGLSIAAHANVAEVLADEGMRTLARELMEETREAAGLLGHEITSEFADWQIERSSSMGGYRPSSMIDFEAGRPVEVEAIWGEPLRQGRAAGAPMVRLEMLYRLIRHLAQRAQA
jgi:2-dehydropantoate 2-reductase